MVTRRRANSPARSARVASNDSDERDTVKDSSPSSYGALVWFALLHLVVIAVFFRESTRMPTPLALDAPVDVFSEARAMQHLTGLASVARMSWAGTKANDAAAAYIQAEMRALVPVGAQRGVTVEVDLQSVSGVTEFDIAGAHMTNVFNNLTNVVVRLRFGADTPDDAPALLVNSHFDTPLASAGAVDARAPIVSMMESVRALLQLSAAEHAAMASRRGAVIFLFNGGEEILQMASTGFIQKHRWAPTVRTVYNCDAVGVRGAAVVFQSGGMPYLRLYKEAAPRPFGTSLAFDIFSSGVVQSDTDYRVFVKHGNVTGIDTAIYRGSEAYHTHLDTVERIEPGLLQHEGDNMLAYVRRVLQSDLLHRDLRGAAYEHAVYFDIVQIYLILYSRFTATVLNLAVAAALAWLVARELRQLGVPVRSAALNVAKLCGVAYGAILCSGVLQQLTARFMWYKDIVLLVPLYVVPLLCGAVWWIERRSQRVAHSARDFERVVFAEIQLLHIFSLVSGTLVGFGAAFMPMLLCACHLCAYGIAALAPRNALLSPLVYALHCVVSTVFITVVFMGTMELFVPLMGRLGGVPADVVLAVMLGILMHLVAYMVPVVAARVGSAARRAALLLLCGVFVAAFVGGFVLVRPSPFDAEHPRRVMLQHAIRAQPFVEGASSINEKPHFFVTVCDNAPIDNMLRTVIANAQSLPTTSKLRRLAPDSTLFTQTAVERVFQHWTQPLDFDTIYPFNHFLQGYVLEAPPLSLRAPVVTVVRATYDAARNERHLVVKADYHVHEAMTFRFRADLVRWTMYENEPMPTQTRGWYVGRHVSGREGSKVLELDVTVRGNASVPFQFAAMRFDTTDDFAEFAELFPDYASVVVFSTAQTSHLL
jgi:hypothetical protein